MVKVAYLGSVLATATLIASCSGSGTPTHPSVAAGGGTATLSASSVAAQPTTPPISKTFTSATYGYTLTLPAAWTPRPALDKWGGEEELDGTSVLADIFGQPSESRGMFAVAAPWKRDLRSYEKFLIAFNAHYHGDYCPQRPNARRLVTVGGQPGVLLAYDCGILVNNVGTVHDGVGYIFVFVDRSVAAATDPTDYATFQDVLRSVRFPA